MKKTQKISEKKFDFENSIEELEKIVMMMEKGELNLEDSLKYFETGVSLVRQCQKSLQEAEQKVKILSEKNNTLEDFTISDKPIQETDEE